MPKFVTYKNLQGENMSVQFGTGTATSKAFQKQLTAERVLTGRQIFPGNYKKGSTFSGSEGNPLSTTPNWQTGGRNPPPSPMLPGNMLLYAGAAVLLLMLLRKKR